MTKINPFKPNSPVPNGMFAGRMNEVLALEKGLFQTKSGQPIHFMVTGDRGIGKSSLLFYFDGLSAGRIKSPDYDVFNFVTINLSISDRLDITSLIKLTRQNIEREVGKVESVRKFLAGTWEFVQRIRVMDSGVSAAEKDAEVEILLDQFTHSLSKTCNRITNPEKDEGRKDGIVFVFDECDNATPPLRLGYFFKTVSEALQRQNCNNVMFVIAGLPDIADKLAQSHPSSIRVFNQLKLGELAAKDRVYVIEKGMEEGNRINSEKTTISDEAKIRIAAFSEGYPHFIQQFSYSAYEDNSDGEISGDDVSESAFRTGGALDAIGDRYYASAFYDKIKSDEYRDVLSIMADNMNNWITKADIRAKFTGSETTLSNALSILVDRKIILKNQSKNGEYRLQQRGFALWIKLFASKSSGKKK